MLANLAILTASLMDDIDFFHFVHPPTGDYNLNEFLMEAPHAHVNESLSDFLDSVWRSSPSNVNVNSSKSFQ